MSKSKKNNIILPILIIIFVIVIIVVGIYLLISSNEQFADDGDYTERAEVHIKDKKETKQGKGVNERCNQTETQKEKKCQKGLQCKHTDDLPQGKGTCQKREKKNVKSFTIIGTDENGNIIKEVVESIDGKPAQGTKKFQTITSISSNMGELVTNM